MEIVYIILGWLFGLLSPSIVNKISEKSKKDSIRKIIFNDLTDVKKRLAPLSFQVYPKYGKLDKKTFEWLKVNSGIDFSQGLENFEKKGLTEEQIIDQFNINGQGKKTATHFKKMHLFATDSHLLNIGLIESDLVEKILEVRFYVEAFNEDIDSYRENLKMTFLPGITTVNHQIVCDEMDRQNLMIAERSMFIVDKINNILDSEK
jgi:hypothetical protein